MSKKLVTVFGVTGQQGGSVAETFTSHPELKEKYTIRGVTRDPSKEKAKALAANGVEIVAGDLSDRASLDKAVAGSYAVFAVTNFWEGMDPHKEVKDGKNLADAAIAAGVRHLVFSTLQRPSVLTNGKLTKISHFESKADIQDYIEQHKAKANLAATYFHPAFFMENFRNLGMLGQGDEAADGPGALKVALPIKPDSRVPFFAVTADTGKYVAGAIEAGPEATDGKSLQAVSDWTDLKHAVHAFQSSVGAQRKVVLQTPTTDEYRKALGDYASDEMLENMELIDQYAYYGNDKEAKQAESDKYLLKGSKLTSFEEFAKAHAPW